MRENMMLISDPRDLHDELLIRKITECRRQLRQLSAYRSREIAKATRELAKLVAQLESEAQRRSLPVSGVGSFSSPGSIEA